MLSIGFVGLPNIGKSTLFNALTNSSVLAANYPFATIEPNVGIVPVPDGRLDKLAAIYNADKIIPATVHFVDIAGLVAGASKGEGLGNQFLGHIRSTTVIVEIVRAFDDPNISHVSIDVAPSKDIDTINTELVLADLETVARRITKLSKEAKANPKLKEELGSYLKAQAILDQGKLVRHELNSEELNFIRDLQLLTAKPIIYVFNISEQELNDETKQEQLRNIVKPAQSVFLSAKLESEFISLDESDAKELRESYSLHHSALESLIYSAYKILGLQSFLTAGEKEVRAWTIPVGSTALQAAGVIHSDFERGFIAAEVVNYNDLINLGSIAACRAAGKLRTEGKTYIMQPDDIVEFRFNV